MGTREFRTASKYLQPLQQAKLRFAKPAAERHPERLARIRERHDARRPYESYRTRFGRICAGRPSFAGVRLQSCLLTDTETSDLYRAEGAIFPPSHSGGVRANSWALHP